MLVLYRLALLLGNEGCGDKRGGHQLVLIIVAARGGGFGAFDW